jgi:hypothetical protein
MSLISKEYDSFFASVMVTLRPYLDEIVCMGGCANALYRFHERVRCCTPDLLLPIGALATGRALRRCVAIREAG